MIPKIAAKGNISLETLAVPAIVVLVGLAAFGLGRLSVKDMTESHQSPASAFASTTPAILAR